MSDEIIFALRRISFFSVLEMHELNELVNLVQIVTMPINEIIMNEGEAATHLSIVLSGKAKVIKKVDDVEDHIADIETGGCVGELEVLDSATCDASVICTEECRLAQISKHDLETFFETFPIAATKILRQILHIMAVRLRESNLNYSNLMRITETM